MGLRANAVFEGGGVKGIALVGALMVAESRGYSWSHLAGTSAGAMIAALSASGYTAAEIRTILETLDYNKFKDEGVIHRLPVVGPVINFALKQGIYEGRFLENWMRRKLIAKGVRTFGDLKSPPGDDFAYRLMIIASDITRGRMLVLPEDIKEYGINPDTFEVARAVRMSTSIPFFFEPVVLKSQGKKEEESSYVVDGGILSNFPLWLFDNTENETNPTLGFRLIDPGEGRPHRITGPLSMLEALFATMLDAHDARSLTEKNAARTICVPSLGVRAIDFNLSGEKSHALLSAGIKAANEFFANWNPRFYFQRFAKPDRKAV
jgi:NTE family protein